MAKLNTLIDHWRHFALAVRGFLSLTALGLTLLTHAGRARIKILHIHECVVLSGVARLEPLLELRVGHRWHIGGALDLRQLEGIPTLQIARIDTILVQRVLSRLI